MVSLRCFVEFKLFLNCTLRDFQKNIQLSLVVRASPPATNTQIFRSMTQNFLDVLLKIDQLNKVAQALRKYLL
ncbi:hypothetical protein WA1_32800 [Scytonema hofmannii PCC 7110]|uniref:Uncharacterized protein n=1 Tax=Scytonema hofmannii PCC 7110 TaxID=128403 RepID=A0A139X481_9CYAN|nr:hypothetical protein WA1_32800 [Scytonema hofmannii PCC 7110]